MSVSKNKATSSLLKSETQSLKRFFTLYVTTVLLMLALIAVYYHQSQEKLMLAQQRDTLSKYALIQSKRLKVLHQFFDERRLYPRDPRFKSAIYDLEEVQIFSLLEDQNITLTEGIHTHKSYIHYVNRLNDFYLGAKYLVIEVNDDGLWQKTTWTHILMYGFLAFLFFMLLGLYLAKLFLKPMRDSIVLLDRFIKDTTHELNTPLSAILANIEMMDKSVMVEKNKTKLNRINIAATTVSNLYKDLTYLTLDQEKVNVDENIALKSLIEDRAEYFAILAQSKKLLCDLDLEEANIVADKRKITRVIDNLISNAIKYNKREGTIGIKLRRGQLEIWDTGIGIEEVHIPLLFDRYARFNDSEGGFGVGLSIVKMILDEYMIDIKVTSVKGEGTKMVLTW